MGLFKKIGNIFRERAEQLDKSLADPVRDTKFAIEDAEREILTLQGKVATFMASNKRTKNRRTDFRAKVRQFKGIAAKAAQAGNESDARQALEQKVQWEEQLTIVDQEIKSNETALTQVKAQLVERRKRVASAKSSLQRRSVQLESANLRRQLAEEASGAGGVIDGINELENELEIAKSEADAAEEISGDAAAASGENLVDKYSGGSSSVDDELAALMTEHGGK